MQEKITKAFKRVFEKRFARFFVVGVWNTFVDLAVLSIMIKVTAAHPEDTGLIILCNTVSGTCSIASSFILNRYFVFKDGGNKVEGKKLAMFILVSLIGAYGINNTVLQIVIHHADWLHTFVYQLVEFVKLDGILTENMTKIFTGKAIAGLSSMLWSFWAYGKFVFKK